MQAASERTVRGDFGDVAFRHGGVTSRFFRREGKFVVRTDGADGALADLEIKYAFGVAPLQQYPIELPGGRPQALSIAWDARPAADGGQRWFHLYPDERIASTHPLHWTKPAQNWNFMCAECHSTNLKKGYDPAARRYATTWSELNVACEACHGPGANQVAWAEKTPGWERLAPDKGLAVALAERLDVRWTIDPASGNARRSSPRASRVEIETCARCHARRSVVSEDCVHGRPLLDTHLPALDAARRNHPTAPRLLAALATAAETSAIVQATALYELGRHPGTPTLRAIERAPASPEAMVRAAALDALEALPPDGRLRLAARLLADPVRAVRIPAGRAVADLSATLLDDARTAARNAAREEYVAAQRVNAERPEAHLALALPHQRRRDAAAAERALREALALDPGFVPAYVNLADPYRTLDRDADGERVPREGLGRAPESADLQHVLGLLLVRQRRHEAALRALGAAASAAPDNARHAYVYAVALHDAGRAREAVAELERSLRRNPVDRGVLIALVQVHAASGQTQAAATHARTLVSLEPGDPALRGLPAQAEARPAVR